jgi:hypothetical protein
MQRCRSKCCNKIIGEKALSTPIILQYTSKHPQRKHVKKQMGKRAMHKHMGNELKGLEVF